ncbi:MAG TPA: hypothetical protein VH854_12210, partial [Thermoanaerobaculia bacterium]|nr:hypothetical protein [Thermoanaerobaculia bacterium]
MRRTAVLTGAGRLLFCALLGAAANTVVAAPTGVPAWEQTFRRNLTGSGAQTPVAARELADGSRIVIVLDNGGVSCVRYDASGSVLSTAAFYPEAGWPFGPQVVAIDSFGGVFVVSEANKSTFPGTTRGDIWTMKFDGITGKALWPTSQTYDSPDHRRDEPLRAEVNATGDVTVMGATYANGGNTNQVILKYSGVSGVPMWDPIVEEANSGTAATDAAGDVYVDSFGVGGNRVSKYSGSTGLPLWSTPGPVGMEARLAHPVGGRLVVCGVPYEGFRQSIETESYDAATGALLWSQQYGDPLGSVGYSLHDCAVGSRGDVFVSGQNRPADDDFALKLNGSNGNIAWGPITLGSATSEPGLSSLRVSAAGDLFVAASLYVPPDYPLSTWRISSNSGSVVWGPVRASDGSCCDSPVWFVASDGGLVYALPRFTDTDLDTVVLERGAQAGDVVGTEHIFEGAAGGAARLNDLTLDPAGDVIVTGNAITGDGTAPWATIKYDHTTGTAIWGRSFPTGFGLSYWPYQVLTDAAGNAIVIGTADVANDDSRLVVQKYAAADGATVWTNGLISNFTPYGIA